MGIAAKLFGLTEHKGYIKKNSKQVKWEGSTTENKTIANQLIMQNEYWAARNQAGKERQKFIPFKELSQGNVHEIY